MGRVHYAFGRDYLKSWDIKDALREVFQNYIDYGEYEVKVEKNDDDRYVNVIITNDYKPDSLEFLRLGNTTKDNGEYIGHHGEGLKAAFLIFTRYDLAFHMIARDKLLYGEFIQSNDIGETFVINYDTIPEDNVLYSDKFITKLTCDKLTYDLFIESIVKEKDILYSCMYGDILVDNKGKGNIYSGGLYIANINNVSRSYNIKPKYLTLDRDRKTPRDFDVDYYTSQMLQSYKKSIVDEEDIIVSYNSRDHQYIGDVTDKEVANIKSVNIDGKRQYYDTVNEEVINNFRVKQTLDNHPKFKKEIKMSKRAKFNHKVNDNKRKGVPTLLRDFKKKHCGGNEDMIMDIDVILDRFKKKK